MFNSQKKCSFVTITTRVVKFYTNSLIMKHLLFILSSIFILNSSACLNETGINLVGELTEFGFLRYRIFDHPERSPNKAKIKERLKELNEKLAQSKELNKDDIYTDIGVYMIYDGNYQEAIDFMHSNVIVKDSNYSFCSNIGVAHELGGNLDSALYWTQKGLDLNPYSHGSSEWIHIKILEAEIAISKDNNWLSSHTIFDFPISKDSVPTIFPDDFDLYDFCTESGYQLGERSFFVREENQDPVFSQLILLHADALALGFDTKKCIPIYLLAAEHDKSLQVIVDKRIAYLRAFNVKNGLSEEEEIAGLGLNGIFEQAPSQDEELDENGESDSVEKPKKKRKIIKGLIYYLGGGFVVLVIVMIFFIRKKPKRP